jgi:hypothetical protein
MRVLLVEDESALRDGLKQALNAAGYAVDTAGNGVTPRRRQPRFPTPWCRPNFAPQRFRGAHLARERTGAVIILTRGAAEGAGLQAG